VLAGAILLRAMVPLSDRSKAELGSKPILLLSGQADPIVPSSNSAHLAVLLSQAGASVTHKVLPAGHQLSQADVTLARDWIGNVAAETA
jgi:phospholipase/carboxylesterase